MLKLLVNLNSKLREKIIPTYKMNETEQHIKDVVDLMLKQKDTDVISSPISGRYYISNKRLQYYIMVNDFGVTITNHKFAFMNTSVYAFKSMLIDIIEEAINQNKYAFEIDMVDNEVALLQSIAAKVNSNFNN